VSELGKIAYEAYCEERLLPGEPRIAWDDLAEPNRSGWDAAADAIATRAIAATRLHDGDGEPEADRQWAVLELMGHRQAIGAITETTLAGRTMITIDRIDTEPAATQHYGPESVYCLTPVTEAQARQLADSRYKTHIVPPALNAAAYIDEDDVEVFSADEVWGADESETAARDDRAAMARDASGDPF
jgi:hypothetical protein